MSSNDPFNELGALSTLPVETLLEIFSYLDAKSLLNLSVNKTAHQLSRDNLLWKNLFKGDFPHKFDFYNKFDPDNWYLLFKNEYKSEYDHLNENQRQFFSLAKKGNIQGLRDANVMIMDLLTLKDKNGIPLLEWAYRANPEQLSTILNPNITQKDLVFVNKQENKIELFDFFEDLPNKINQTINLSKPGVSGSRFFKAGVTPLMLAARLGETAILEFLLSRGAEVNSKDKANLTPLMYAVLHGNKAAIDLLIKNGAEISNLAIQKIYVFKENEYKDRNDIVLTEEDNALTIAIQLNREDIALSLLDSTLQFKPEVLNLALIDAAHEGMVEVVTRLLDRGADVNFKNKAGYTALGEALLYRSKISLPLLQVLIDNGADIVKYNGFLDAINNNKKEVIDLLFSKATGKTLNDALVKAVAANNTKAVGILLEKMASSQVSVDPGQSETIFFTTLQNANNEMTKLLLEHQAVDINAKNKEGYTPLMYAMKQYRDFNVLADSNYHMSRNLRAKKDLITTLLNDERVNLTITLNKNVGQFKKGDTALDVARELELFDIAKQIEIKAQKQGQPQKRQGKEEGQEKEERDDREKEKEVESTKTQGDSTNPFNENREPSEEIKTVEMGTEEIIEKINIAIKNYLAWMNENAQGTRGLTRFSHWYHGGSGVGRAEELRKVANNSQSSDQDIVTKMVEVISKSSNAEHSLRNFLKKEFGESELKGILQNKGSVQETVSILKK